MIGTKKTISLVEQESAFEFSDTLNRVIAAIASGGMRLFSRIDHAAGAAEVGMKMPPTVLLVYGNPKGGTPIMLAAPSAGLDLPLHALVRVNEAGRTIVSFHPVEALLVAAGAPEAMARSLAPAQAILLEAVRA